MTIILSVGINLDIVSPFRQHPAWLAMSTWSISTEKARGFMLVNNKEKLNITGPWRTDK